MSIQALPRFRLTGSGVLTDTLASRGIRTFRDATAYVRALPYGRNADRADLRCVLLEERGTCSTKHALLAAVAREAGRHVPLMLGIFAMDDGNTPGVGTVLDQWKLAYLPEAHCYLSHAGTRIDATRPGARTAWASRLVIEAEIAPEQAVSYKETVHQRYLRCWAAGQGLDFAEVWRAREACIHALSTLDAAATDP